MRESALQDVLQAALAALAAVLIYSLAGEAGPGLLVVLNAFSIVVLYFSVGRGEVFGAVLGTLCGLIQDAFSLGVFGVAGLTKTLLGFFAGYVARRVDVAAVFRNFLFMLVLSYLELLLWLALSALVRQEPLGLHRGLVLLQPVLTAALASGLCAAERRLAARSARAA